MAQQHVSIDAYIATFPPEVRERLEQVRAAIRAADPVATEAISYNIPTLRHGGTYLLYFAGWKQHISIYPVPAGDPALADLVAPWHVAKGTLKFPHAEPLPLDLVPHLVAARLAEIGS